MRDQVREALLSILLDGQAHTIKITTPTGHNYLSRAP